MKILWVKTGFLHPTTRGGDIRTLEMLKHLHALHEVHYAAPSDPEQPEGLARCHEYCSHVHSTPFQPARKPSAAFFLELLRGVADPLPVSIFRWHSAPFARLLAGLLEREHFDSVVCDFLVSAVNLPTAKHCVLFQHNVETTIWQRLAENERHPLKRAYLRGQAVKMFRYEREVCRAARSVVAVSEVDAQRLREMSGSDRVAAIPTGVDTEFFARPSGVAEVSDLVFVGSMDYLPNIEGVRYFVHDVLPLIWATKPDCTFTIVGRKPAPEIVSLGGRDPRIRVVGTVPDIRPYLWGAPVSVVPLLSGGGTRLKIYEAMAAGTAVVSTTVGAEGLPLDPRRDIRLADTAERFAAECVALLSSKTERDAMADAARRLVAEQFSWKRVAEEFEKLL